MPTALIRKPKTKPLTPFATAPDSLHREGNWLWIPVRGEWRDVAAKPEEIVRQTFIRHLVDHYGYSLAQMDQGRRTQHGHKSPRADIVIWETAEKKANNNTPVLVVECKSEGVDINVKDYYQGESYTRAVGCEFFIAQNTRFTAVFKLVPGLPGDFVQINEIARERLGRREAHRGNQEQAPRLQSQGVSGPPFQVPFHPTRRAQDGARPSVRHDLQDPVRQDVRRTVGFARHLHGGLSRPARFNPPSDRSTGP
jgi:hypothetical protein